MTSRFHPALAMSDDLILEHILSPCGTVSSKRQPELAAPVYTEQVKSSDLTGSIYLGVRLE